MPKKNKKLFYVFILAAAVVAVLVFGFFLSLQNQSANVYIYPENPKQGDTIFIKIKSNGRISGKFGNADLVFYKMGKLPEWISFFGVDADLNPGDYKIEINFPLAGKMEKDIKVLPADFTISKPAKTPIVSESGITQEKAIRNITQTDNPAIRQYLGKFTDAPYFSNSFSYPLASMRTSGFSFGRFLDFGKSLVQHFGVDLKAPSRTKIYSINDGKVVATLSLANYGNTVIVDHGMDIFSLYLHLAEFSVKEGDMVKRGQMVGYSGDTGYVTAPHLHFSVRVGKSRVDPIAFIKTSQQMEDNLTIAGLLNRTIFMLK